MKVAHLRYLILRTHEWDDAVIDAIRRDLEPQSGRRHDGQEASAGVGSSRLLGAGLGSCRGGRVALHHQVATVLRVEQLEAGGVHPELRLNAHA